jgi:uroporphyrinogen-III decarboxylase
MRPEQWETFKTAAKSRRADRLPVSLIIDSPWIPGYLGIKHTEYYFDPEVWFQANLRIAEEFPEIIVFPSWWAEYGMAIEPSAFGCKIRFFEDQPPAQLPSLSRLEDVDHLSPVDPRTDGLMPAALHRYQSQRTRISDAGYSLPVVAARGPLCTASFVRGLTELLTDMVDNSQAVHKLIAYTTEVTINWLRAQAEIIGEGVEGIFILDDVPGLLSRKFYLEFAHPYLKQIFSSFPGGWVKVYHNDANIEPFLEDLACLGFDVLNWSHKLDLTEVRTRTAGKICLMGNVPPLEIGARGTPHEVRTSVLKLLEKAGSDGIIVSLGGGVSPAMPRANILAMVEAIREFNSRL